MSNGANTKAIIAVITDKINDILSINQSINLYLSQAKAHTNTHAHTHAQKTTTMYNKRNKKKL